MTDNQLLLWLASVSILVGSFILLSLKTSPQLAIGIVVGCAMIAPAWLHGPPIDTLDDSIVASGFDVKMAVTVSCLMLYCFMPGRTFPLRLVLSDFAMLTLIIVHFVSDITNSGFSWSILGRMYGEWFAPYVAGRLAIQTLAIPDRLWQTLAIASAVVGSLAVIESVFQLKVFEVVFGEPPFDGGARYVTRWGVHRAYGPTNHPIYLGALQLLLLAWPTYGVTQALRHNVSFAWIVLPLFSVAGIVATGSRAPIIGICFFALAFVFFRVKASRFPITVMSCLAILVASTSFWWIVERLEDWSDETRSFAGQKVQVDGEKVAYTGLRTRIIMLDVYRIAITRAGFLGYGSISTTGFPINVPISGQEIETLKRVRFIDNAYVLLLLRFGYFGLVAFLLACAACLIQFFWLSQITRSSDLGDLTSALASSLVASYFVIATVWMPHEIGFPMLWTMGISSGLFRSFTLGEGDRKLHRGGRYNIPSAASSLSLDLMGVRNNIKRHGS